MDELPADALAAVESPACQSFQDLWQLIAFHRRIPGSRLPEDFKGSGKIRTLGAHCDVVRCMMCSNHLRNGNVYQLIESHPLRFGQIASRFEQGRL